MTGLEEEGQDMSVKRQQRQAILASPATPVCSPSSSPVSASISLLFVFDSFLGAIMVLHFFCEMLFVVVGSPIPVQCFFRERYEQYCGMSVMARK